ncbi:MAG: hypothetical protein GY906_34695 [bacterium]|nr:hypothetical protein [bacterium]
MAEEIQAAVVLRYKDGSVVPCSLVRPFSPKEECVEVKTQDGAHLKVSIDELKAVFFLKDSRRRGAELHMQVRTEAEAMESSALARVEFFDGEIIRGRIQHYSVADMGFFLYPCSPDTNNEWIFVAAHALTTLDIES